MASLVLWYSVVTETYRFDVLISAAARGYRVCVCFKAPRTYTPVLCPEPELVSFETPPNFVRNEIWVDGTQISRNFAKTLPKFREIKL